MSHSETVDLKLYRIALECCRRMAEVNNADAALLRCESAQFTRIISAEGREVGAPIGACQPEEARLERARARLQRTLDALYLRNLELRLEAAKRKEGHDGRK